jgi:hypothetical protein
MREHYILNQHPCSQSVFQFISDHKLTVEVHLNRTRFWVPLEGSVATEFALRFLDACPQVDHLSDLATGYKL